MNKELYMFCNKLYNELLTRKRINPDKYEREDAFMSIINKIESGCEIKESFTSTFTLIHNIEISEILYESCYENCKGFQISY